MSASIDTLAGRLLAVIADEYGEAVADENALYVHQLVHQLTRPAAADAWVTRVSQVRGALSWLLYVAEHGDDESGQDQAAREAIGGDNYYQLQRLLSTRDTSMGEAL